MTPDDAPVSDADRDQAAALYAEAQKLESHGNYYAARTCYERSLALVECATVRASYLRLLATIGPQ